MERKYIDAEIPPTRRSPVASTKSTSDDTIAGQTGDIHAKQLDGHLSWTSTDICPVTPGKGASGADGGNLPGPARDGTPAGRAATMEEAKAVLKQFLPRFNRRFRVPPECPDPALRPLEQGLPQRQVLCFKHRRQVARDNTVKYHRHTLQLLPDHKRRSYAGAVVVVLEELDGRLSLQHEGGIIASQEAPPSPGALRTGRDPSTNVAVPSPDPRGPADSPATVPDPLKTKMDEAKEYGHVTDEEDLVAITVTALPRTPTFLQRERWKAMQQAKRKGLSIRGMARELGIHRDTVRRCIDAESPPTRRTPGTAPPSTYNTISD